MSKMLGRLSLVLGVCLGGAVLFLWIGPISVTVRNDSPQRLTGITVSMQGRTLIFPDLALGHSAQRWFRNTGRDDHYSLVARRDDGTQIHGDGGYITSGYVYGWAQFVVAPSGNVAFTEKYN